MSKNVYRNQNQMFIILLVVTTFIVGVVFSLSQFIYPHPLIFIIKKNCDTK